MRTIKFRGKTNGNEWVYGYYVYTYPNEHKIFGKDRTSIEVMPDSVGQFTGLLDKDGNEIFEGDIIHLKGKEYEEDWGIVTWHENGYYYLDDTFGKRKKDCVKPIGDFFDAICDRTQITVNGNIHDNPKLKKEV